MDFQLNPDDLADAREITVELFESLKDYPPPVSVGALVSVIARIYKDNPPQSGPKPFVAMCACALNTLLREENEK